LTPSSPARVFERKAVDNPAACLYSLLPFAIQFNAIDVGLWLSLVERFVRDEEAAGSNPASPTTYYVNAISTPPRGKDLRTLKRDENAVRLHSAKRPNKPPEALTAETMGSRGQSRQPDHFS